MAKNRKPKESRTGAAAAAVQTKGAPAAPQEAPKGTVFPIVGIGASAGGLEAFQEMVRHVPADPGMALVLVQHLDPRHESMLSELLSRSSKMPVIQVADGMAVETNCVYVIPPNTHMTVVDSTFKLIPRTLTKGLHMPIDYFFRSLAHSQGNRAIGVILSGTASDGALGIEAIKGEGGITFVQDDRTAKFAGMPRSAIATGSVDFILPVERIAEELVRIGRHPYVSRPHPPHDAEIAEGVGERAMQKLLTLLYRANGVDFTLYKPSTVRRRIMRRMTLQKIERLPDYANFLRDHPAEVEALFRDMLITVTGFFREPEAFEALKKAAFPAMLKNRSPGKPIRIWVLGCSTGEEVYSVAIVLLEYLGDRAGRTPVQIFATDVSEEVLAKARAGMYIQNIAVDVSAERLRRFFQEVNGKYQINKSIRDMCVFARQNILEDPPFSNLDLISCRNVLIYLDGRSHKRVVPLLHYSLKPHGYLMLGASEAIGAYEDLFSLADRKNKIYSKKLGLARLALDLGPRHSFAWMYEKEEVAKPGKKPIFREMDLYREADRVITSNYSPPCVLVDEQMQILQFRGDTGRYLEPAQGRATFDLLRMAREGLMVKLREAVQEAHKKEAVAVREKVSVRVDGKIAHTRIRVIPIKAHTDARFYVVVFEEASAPQPAPAISARAGGPGDRAQLRALKEELVLTRDHVQSIVEEYEASNEELKSANEEILSSNEELQSTNEELETAKEELQSSNEELTTMNEEIQNRNRELAQANNDTINLLASANLAIAVLGRDLGLRMMTPQAEKLLNVYMLPGDVGRPITDLHLSMEIPRLEKLVNDAIDRVTIQQVRVRDQEGRTYTLWVRPYKTADNQVDGAVLVFGENGGAERLEA